MDSRWWNSLDRVLIVTVLLLCAIGMCSIFSATYEHGPGWLSQLIMKQALWILLGLGLMVAVSLVDYHIVTHYAYYLYGATLILLLSLSVLGTFVFGSRRWFHVGPVSFQPSELAKFTIIFALVKYLYDHKGRVSVQGGFVMSLIIAFLPTFLIARQPDLGTAMVFVPVIVILLYLIGLPLQYMLMLIGSGFVLSPVAWLLLKDYQKQRILTFLDPYADPQGAGYTIIQSQIAVGSGRWFGRGWLKGTQSQLDFIPVNHTDFIFSVYAEEWGFLGSLVLLSLIAVMMFQGIKIATRARDHLGTLIALGFTALLIFQAVLNIAVTVGLLPVTGVPLPFVSYGGSALVMNFMMIGVLLNIRYWSQKFIA